MISPTKSTQNTTNRNNICGPPNYKPVLKSYNHISEFLDYFNKPIVKKQLTYIRDSTDFTHKIEAIKVPENTILVTLDVVSMYTNTMHNEAIQLVGKALNAATTQTEYTISKPSTKYMFALLKLILKDNNSILIMNSINKFVDAAWAPYPHCK